MKQKMKIITTTMIKEKRMKKIRRTYNHREEKEKER
jgi:hypothetical protein